MSASASSSQFLYFLILIAAVVLLRLRRIVHGTRVSLVRTLGYTAFYFALAGAFISSSYFLGVPTEYFVIDAALLLLGAFWAFKHAGKNLIFWKQGGGTYVKGASVIYVIYVVGLIARLAIEYLFIPNFGISVGPTVPGLSSSALFATIATDLLLALGAGLLIGRNIQILKRYQKIQRGMESATENPNVGV